MAINQTKIALDLAQRSVQHATGLIASLEQMELILEHGLRAGISFVAFDDDIAAMETVQHVNGATLNKLLAIVVPAIRTFLETETVTGETYEVLIYKARR